MEERLNSMTEEARSCHHRRTQLETRAEVLRTSIRNKELNKKKHRNEVESLKTTQPKLMKQIAECKEQIKAGFKEDIITITTEATTWAIITATFSLTILSDNCQNNQHPDDNIY